MEPFFIHHPEQAYHKLGSYWAKHKHIRQQNTDPSVALYALRDQLKEQAQEIGLKGADQPLSEVTYSDEILRKMPSKVFGTEDTLTTGLELELEEDVEGELDVEDEMVLDVEESVQQDLDRLVRFNAEIPFYFGWNWEADTFPLASRIHPAFHPKLTFSENFLPITRTDPLFKRTPFDPKMNRLGALFITASRSMWGNSFVINEVRLCDSLDTVMPHDERAYIPSNPAIVYDTRTNKIVRVYGEAKDKDAIRNLAMNLSSITAQAKFFDGQYHDYQYTPQEWEGLKQWLAKNNPQELHEFFAKKVLKSRQSELPAFQASPLNHLFQNLLADQERALEKRSSGRGAWLFQNGNDV